MCTCFAYNVTSSLFSSSAACFNLSCMSLQRRFKSVSASSQSAQKEILRRSLPISQYISHCTDFIWLDAFLIQICFTHWIDKFQQGLRLSDKLLPCFLVGPLEQRDSHSSLLSSTCTCFPMIKLYRNNEKNIMFKVHTVIDTQKALKRG